MEACPECGTAGGYDLTWEARVYREPIGRLGYDAPLDVESGRQWLTFKPCGHTFFKDPGDTEWRTEMVRPGS